MTFIIPCSECHNQYSTYSLPIFEIYDIRPQLYDTPQGYHSKYLRPDTSDEDTNSLVPMLQHESEKNSRLRTSCDLCIQSKARCSKDKPSCRRCARRGHQCVYGVARRAGRPRKCSQASNKGPGVDDQHKKPEPPGPPDWTMSTPACLCQQYLSSFRGLDESDTNLVLADTVTIAQTEEVIPSPKLDSGVQRERFFEPALLRSNTLTPIDSTIDSSFDFLSDTFQEGIEEFMAGYYASTPDGGTGHGSSMEMVTTPTNTPPLQTDSASLRSNMGQENDEQHPAGRPNETTLFFSDIERAFPERLKSLQLDSIVGFIISNGQSDSEVAVCPANRLHNSCLCFHSAAINKLLILVSHPALNPRSSRLSLDIVLLFESFIYEIHESFLECRVCRMKSSHSRAFLFVFTDWITEILRNIVQGFPSREEVRDVSSVGLGSVEDSSIIRIGRLDLDGHLQELCIRSLIKLRLSRLLLTIDKITKHDDERRGAVFQQPIRIMMQGIHHRIESVLGMVEL